MPIGEKVTSPGRYIKCPPAASFFWRDGYSIDAGTAHIVHSNLSHLSEVNRRPLGAMTGPGQIVGYDTTKNENGYTNHTLVDAGYPTDTSDPLYQVRQIAWYVDGVTPDAMVIGPIAAAPMLLVTDPPGYKPRKIGWRVVGAKGSGAGGTAGALFLAAAITRGPVAPSVRAPLASKVSGNYTVTGAATWEDSLSLLGPVSPSREMRSRASGADSDSTTDIIDLYLWLGWYSTNTGTGAGKDSIYHFEAWEII